MKKCVNKGYGSEEGMDEGDMELEQLVGESLLEESVEEALSCFQKAVGKVT